MQTTCPRCAHTFNARRSQKGCAEAKTWTRLPSNLINLLCWWLSNFPQAELSKDQLSQRYSRTTISSLVARVSELLALDLVTRKERKHQQPPVVYRLNIGKVVRVLNNGGDLSVLKEVSVP